MRWITALLSLAGTVLIFAATVPPEDATSRISAWINWLGIGALPGWLRVLVGIAFFAVAALVWIAIKYRRLEPQIDHWADRSQLEISVIANVSAGREPTDMPIASDPENTRLRLLKDAIEHGQLEATLRDDELNMSATVTLDAFREYARGADRRYWHEVLDRWEAGQSDAAAAANTFSASLSLRDAVQELAPEVVDDVDTFSQAIRPLDVATLRLLDERAITLEEARINTGLDGGVTDILIRTEIGDREVADQRGHEKDLAKIQARAPLWAEIFKVAVWIFLGVILTLIGQEVV